MDKVDKPIRELIDFHIGLEKLLVRYDVFNGEDTLYCSGYIDDSKDIKVVRQLCLLALLKEMDKRGWNTSDLKQIPIPQGMKGNHVAWEN